MEDINKGKRASSPTKNDFLLVMETIPDIHWKYLESLLKYLKFCYDFTIEVQYEDETLSMAYLALKVLMYDSFQTNVNDYTIIIDFVQDLKNSFAEQFEICLRNEDILLCCLLDTRTKDFLESNRTFFTKDEYEFAKSILKKKLEYTGNTTPSSSINPVIGKFDKFRTNNSLGGTEQISNEYERWIVSKESISTRYYNFYLLSSSIFEYWRKARFEYPTISFIARDILSEEPTSCSSERMFSKCGLLSSYHKASTNSDKLEMKLICYSFGKLSKKCSTK